MSRCQDIRRRWLPSLRQFVVSLLDLIANTSGMYLIPPPYLSGPAAPDAGPCRYRPPAPDSGSVSLPDAESVGPDVTSAPLTASECRAWERLVRELRAQPKERSAADPGSQ
jgi:hypothetical protein